MNGDERLRRRLRDALDPGPGWPRPDLRERIVSGLAAGSRRRPSRDGLPRRAWVPALATLLAALVVGEVINVQHAQSTYAGRIEFQVEFLSSQAQPADEYRAMTQKVLAGFPGMADFNSQAPAGEDIQRVLYEQAIGHSTVDLIALTQGDLITLQKAGALEDLTPLLQRLRQDRQLPQSLLDDARLDSDYQYYVPWLQATYLMVVNRHALAYLPPGAAVNSLTYDQLIQWGANLEAATGRKRIGLPADLSPKGGLIYRFVQGFAYPSFTGTALTGFQSSEAVQMWTMLQHLWAVTSDISLHSSEMSTPLLDGDVWVAWDHQARLKMALDGLPDQFIAVPAPRGPKGLGYMAPVVGLAIPKKAPNERGAEALIDWLTRPRQQAAAAANLGFTPAIEHVGLGPTQSLVAAVAHVYQTDRTAVEALIPQALGTDAEEFTRVYQDAILRILVRHEDIPTVLAADALRLQQLIDHAKAPCWLPDPSSQGRPCPVG